MSKQSKLSGITLMLIGIIAGALIFSQMNEATQPVVFSSQQIDSDSIMPADRPLTSLREMNQAFVDIAKAVNPTVITVFTEKVFKVRGSPFFGSPFEDFFEDFFGWEPRRRQQPN